MIKSTETSIRNRLGNLDDTVWVQGSTKYEKFKFEFEFEGALILSFSFSNFTNSENKIHIMNQIFKIV